MQKRHFVSKFSNCGQKNEDWNEEKCEFINMPIGKRHREKTKQNVRIGDLSKSLIEIEYNSCLLEKKHLVTGELIQRHAMRQGTIPDKKVTRYILLK